MRILLGNEIIDAENIADFSVEGKTVIGCDECGKLSFIALFEDEKTAEKALHSIEAQIELSNKPIDILTAAV